MTYYFSTSDGDDSRTSVQAQSSATPWQTLGKLNSFYPSLLPGDQVLFKRGDTFYGSIIATKSGTAGNPITHGAYSTGADPILTGLFDVPAWTNLGGDLWESTAAVSALSSLNMVLVGGVFKPIGRWPNSGYNTIASHTGGDNAAGTAASITSGSSLPADFTGGEVVIRKRHWIIDRATITSQVGDTLNHINPSIYGSLDGWGYFVQNHLNCLDNANDWLYNPATKKITIISSGSPSAVKVSSIDTLVAIGTQAYLTFSGLQFDGSNSQHFSVSSGNNLIFTGCTFRYAGINVFTTQSAAHHISVLTNTVSRTNNNFITSNRAQNWVILGNDIEDTAQVAGMGQSRDGNYEGMNAIGANSIIQYNTLLRTGYLGIEFVGGGVQVRNNFVDTFCNIKDDGAGIYTYTGPAATVYTQRIVDHNIVINGGGASDGTNTSNEDAFGIYMDDNSSNVTISNNTVANCGAAGLYFHASHDITATGNTFYNCALTAHAQFLEVFPGATSTAAVRNLKLTGNKFISRESTQMVARMTTSEANMSQWPLGLTNANYNGNYYARPVNEDATTFQVVTAGGTTNTNLPGWTAASGALLDNTSNISPITLADPADIRFEYNATNAPVTVSLGTDNYIDVAGIGYTGDISLGAWESLVLFLTDAPPPPPTAISQIIIDFTPCAEMPVEGYQILYRVVGDTAYIDAGFFTTSPAVIAVDYPAGTLFEGVIRSDCGDVPWAGGGGSGGGGCAPVYVFSVTLPDGTIGDPYSYSVALNPAWTTPIDLTVITAPSWMTIAIVGTDIVFSGTPDAEGTDIAVQFTLTNDCGSVEIDAEITIPCIAATIEAGDLPNAYLDNPYSYTLTLSGTGPFSLGAVTKPAWMTITIVDDQLIFSGTPTSGDDGEGVSVSVEVMNDCGTDTFIDTLDVIVLPAFRIDHFRSFVSGTFSRVSMTSLDAMDGYVVWGDGIIEPFSIGAATPHDFDHIYASLGDFDCKFYFTANTRIIQFTDLFEGDYVRYFSHTDNFTNFTGSITGVSLNSVFDISNCLPPAASHISKIAYTGHATSTMGLVDFSTLEAFCTSLAVFNFPELQYIINLPTTLTARYAVSGNPQLIWMDGGGAAALPQAASQQINGNNSISGGWAYRDPLQLATCNHFLFDDELFDTSEINSFLVDLDANGITGGIADMNNQTPAAPPTGAGATAKANLIAKGWTVITD